MPTFDQLVLEASRRRNEKAIRDRERLLRYGLTQAPREDPTSNRWIPDQIEGPMNTARKYAIRAADQVVEDLVNTPMGIVELQKAMALDLLSAGLKRRYGIIPDLYPERTGGLLKGMGERIAEDVRHPGRNPGHLIMDAASLAAFKTPSRVGTFARTYREQQLANKMGVSRGDLPPSGGPRQPLPSGWKPLDVEQSPTGLEVVPDDSLRAQPPPVPVAETAPEPVTAAAEPAQVTGPIRDSFDLTAEAEALAIERGISMDEAVRLIQRQDAALAGREAVEKRDPGAVLHQHPIGQLPWEPEPGGFGQMTPPTQQGHRFGYRLTKPWSWAKKGKAEFELFEMGPDGVPRPYGGRVTGQPPDRNLGLPQASGMKIARETSERNARDLDNNVRPPFLEAFQGSVREPTPGIFEEHVQQLAEQQAAQGGGLSTAAQAFLDAARKSVAEEEAIAARESAVTSVKLNDLKSMLKDYGRKRGAPNSIRREVSRLDKDLHLLISHGKNGVIDAIVAFKTKKGVPKEGKKSTVERGVDWISAGSTKAGQKSVRKLLDAAEQMGLQLQPFIEAHAQTIAKGRQRAQAQIASAEAAAPPATPFGKVKAGQAAPEVPASIEQLQPGLAQMKEMIEGAALPPEVVQQARPGAHELDQLEGPTADDLARMEAEAAGQVVPEPIPEPPRPPGQVLRPEDVAPSAGPEPPQPTTAEPTPTPTPARAAPPPGELDINAIVEKDLLGEKLTPEEQQFLNDYDEMANYTGSEGGYLKAGEREQVSSLQDAAEAYLAEQEQLAQAERAAEAPAEPAPEAPAEAPSGFQKTKGTPTARPATEAAPRSAEEVSASQERLAKAQEELDRIEAKQAEEGQPESGSPEAREWYEAKQNLKEAEKAARGGLSEREAGMSKRQLGVSQRDLEPLGVPKERMGAIGMGIQRLALAGRLREVAATREVFVRALGEVAGETVHDRWRAGRGFPEEMPPGIKGMPKDFPKTSAVPPKSALKEAAKAFFGPVQAGSYSLGPMKERKYKGRVAQIPPEQPLSNFWLLRKAQPKVFDLQKRLERRHKGMTDAQYWRRVHLYSRTLGLGKTMRGRRKASIEKQFEFMRDEFDLEQKLYPGWEKDVKKALPVMEAHSKQSIKSEEDIDLAALQKDLKKKGVDIPDEDAKNWADSTKLAMQLEHENLARQGKDPEGFNKKRSAVDYYDTLQQLIRFGVLDMKLTGYALPNLGGNLAIYLADHGFSPRSVQASQSMAKQIRNQYPEVQAKIQGLMKTGGLRGMHQKGGAVKWIARGTGKSADIYNRIMDQPFRERAFYTEARRHGFKTQEDIARLFTDKKLSGKRYEIAQRANANMIDFGRLGDMERKVLRRVIMFYPWLKAASIYSGRFLTEHPVQSLAYVGAGRQAEEKLGGILGPVPSYMRGYIPIGKRNEKTGEARAINPAAATVLGTLGETLAGAKALTLGETKESEAAGEFFNPMIAALASAAFHGDPLTGKQFPAGKSAGSIFAQELFQSMAPTKFAFTDLPRAQKLASGDLERKNVLFPRSTKELIMRYGGGGIVPGTVNTREALSRASAERRSLVSKPKAQELKWKDNAEQMLLAARDVGLIGEKDNLPEPLVQAFERRTEREKNIANFESQLGRKAKTIERIHADLNMLTRLGEVKEGYAQQLQDFAAGLPDDQQKLLARKIREMLLGGDILSRYLKAITDRQNALGQDQLSLR